MAFVRAAGAVIRRATTPMVGSALPTSFSDRICPRHSFRTSDVPIQRISDHFKGWTAEELVVARRFIDSELEKGLAVIITGKDVKMESAFRMISQQLTKQQLDITKLRNKKGDIASVNIGQLGSLNLISAATLLLKAEETWHMTPVIQAWLEKLLG